MHVEVLPEIMGPDLPPSSKVNQYLAADARR
jgi:hypothetical protein